MKYILRALGGLILTISLVISLTACGSGGDSGSGNGSENGGGGNPTDELTPTMNSGPVHNVGSWPESVTTGDFDKDGHLDLATANALSNDVSVLIYNRP